MKSLFKLFSSEPKPFTIIEPTYEWEGNKGRSPSGQFNLHMFDKVISETFLTFEQHEAYPLRTLRFAAYSFMLDQPISYVKSKEGFNFWFENKSSLPDARLKSELSSKNLSENAFKTMNEWLPMYAVGKVRSEVASVPFSVGVLDDNEKKLRAKRFLRTFGQLFLSDASSTMWAEVEGKQVNLFVPLRNLIMSEVLDEAIEAGGFQVVVNAVEIASEQRQKDIEAFIENFNKRKSHLVPSWKRVETSSINKFGDYDSIPLKREREEYFKYEYGEDGLPFIGTEFIIIPEINDYITNAQAEWSLDDYPEDGHLFEVWVADKLKKLGWEVYVTSGSGDQGVDVIAEKDGVRVGLQCKQYKGSVGNDAVQQVIAGKSYYGLKKGVVVTTGKYTKSAKQLASSSGIGLLSHQDLEFFDDKVGGI